MNLGLSLSFAAMRRGSVNPTITSATYTAGSGGNPASIDLSVTYAGADTLTAYAVTGTDPVTVSKAQLSAGSGGTNTLEFFNFGITAPSDTDNITGLTAASESADRILLYVVEDNNGGESAIETVTVSGLDFTSPQFSSAEVGNVNADTLRVTLTEALYGTVDYTDFTLTGNTITAAAFTEGNTYIDLTLGTTATSGDDYTGDLSFSASGSSLTDAKGNALGSFASQDVTNNVGAGSTISVVGVLMQGGATVDLTGLSLAEGDEVIAFAQTAASADRDATISTSGYTVIADQTSGASGAIGSVIIGRKRMGATPDTEVAFAGGGFSSDGRARGVIVLRGVDAVTPLDVAAVSQASTGQTLPSLISITPTTAGAKIVSLGFSAQSVASASGSRIVPSGQDNQNDFKSTDGTSYTSAVAVGTHDWTSGAYTPSAYTADPARSSTADNAFFAQIALRPA